MCRKKWRREKEKNKKEKGEKRQKEGVEKRVKKRENTENRKAKINDCMGRRFMYIQE